METEHLFDTCMFDMCVDPDDDDLRCQHFNLYAMACRDEGVDVGNWRNSIQGCGKSFNILVTDGGTQPSRILLLSRVHRYFHTRNYVSLLIIISVICFY